MDDYFCCWYWWWKFVKKIPSLFHSVLVGPLRPLPEPPLPFTVPNITVHDSELEPWCSPLCHSSLLSLIFPLVLHFFPPFCFSLYPHTCKLCYNLSYFPSPRSSASFVCFWFDLALSLLVERMWCAGGTVEWLAKMFISLSYPRFFWLWENGKQVCLSLFLIFFLGPCSRRVPAQSQPLHCRPFSQAFINWMCKKQMHVSCPSISAVLKDVNRFQQPLLNFLLVRNLFSFSLLLCGIRQGWKSKVLYTFVLLLFFYFAWCAASVSWAWVQI